MTHSPYPTHNPAADGPVNDPDQSPAWRSYLMPGTDACCALSPSSPTRSRWRCLNGWSAPTRRPRCVATPHRPRSFDLAHLSNIHEQLFADVYPFAGQLRYVDLGKPGQTGEPFLHHRWIETYTAAVTEQLRAQNNLVELRDPGQWADRAAYHWAAILHAHPFRDGNGRSARIWMEDLASAAGHDSTGPASAPNATCTSRSPRPRRLRADASTADRRRRRHRRVDREVEALTDVDKLQHAQAWARTGMVFGTSAERATLTPQLADLEARIDAVRVYLDAHPARAASIDQPAEQRWRGLGASVLPTLPLTDDWPRFASELDAGVAAGIDVGSELPRLAARDAPTPSTPVPPPTTSSGHPNPRRAPGPSPNRSRPVPGRPT